MTPALSRASRWWKVDLQVATPGGGFKLAGSHDLRTSAGKLAAARELVDLCISKGLDAIALADHNSGEWVDVMKEAAAGTSLTVFPGFELTTGSGQDGTHVVVIGDVGVTSQQIDRLIHGACGFGEPDHPTHGGNGEPLPSPKSIGDILDELPDGYLVLAPHALGDNGIARQDSINKSVRWKALHHNRLSAIDVGDVDGGGNEGSWRHKFRNRELDFPCLKRVAFMSTSDAYEPDQLGERFTWVRMTEPTLEGLRQAVLDYQARIICPWEPRAQGITHPNEVDHAWVSHIGLASMANSSQRLEVDLDPHLNVVIGGRGSGKSTVVAGLRLLYGTDNVLPENVRSELEQFDNDVFGEAALTGTHVLPLSGEQQTARWTFAGGSQTERADGTTTPTSYRVRVVSQKELYERARSTKDDPTAASRSLIGLIDQEGIKEGRAPTGRTFEEEREHLRTEWSNAAKRIIEANSQVAGLVAIRARIEEAERALSTLDSSEVVSLRRQHDDIQHMDQGLRGALASVSDVRTILSEALPVPPPEFGSVAGQSLTDEQKASGAAATELVNGLVGRVTDGLNRLVESISQDVAALDAHETWRGWRQTVDESTERYEGELSRLAEQGVNSEAYDEVRQALARDREAEQAVLKVQAGLGQLQKGEEDAWTALMQWHEDRHNRRRTVSDQAGERSRVLRFEVRPFGNLDSWVTSVRRLLNLRADGFLNDVPATAKALFDQPTADDLREALKQWRQSLISGDLQYLAGVSDNGSRWVSRLKQFDIDIRLRMATEFPDDLAEMYFVQQSDSTNGTAQWQSVADGSPGQRTAAMLALVLHLGNEPLVLDQPEDDLDTEWLSSLVIQELRASRWKRQLIVVTHSANIPVNGDADRVIVLENRDGSICVRTCADNATCVGAHSNPIEIECVRRDVQNIMEGGVDSFVRRERKYNNELSNYRIAMLESPA